MAKKRYTLLLSERARQVLAELQLSFGKDTRADVLDLALTVLSWAKDEMETGHVIGSFDDKKGTFREVVLPRLVGTPTVRNL